MNKDLPGHSEELLEAKRAEFDEYRALQRKEAKALARKESLVNPRRK